MTDFVKCTNEKHVDLNYSNTTEIKMTDKELLELAADAYGIKRLDWINGSQCFYYDDEETGRECWNPLNNREQSFQIMVKLRMEIDHSHPESKKLWVFARCQGTKVSIFEEFDEEYQRDGATRRAIVRAAAEIGKNM